MMLLRGLGSDCHEELRKNCGAEDKLSMSEYYSIYVMKRCLPSNKRIVWRKREKKNEKDVVFKWSID